MTRALVNTSQSNHLRSTCHVPMSNNEIPGRDNSARIWGNCSHEPRFLSQLLLFYIKISKNLFNWDILILVIIPNKHRLSRTNHGPRRACHRSNSCIYEISFVQVKNIYYFVSYFLRFYSVYCFFIVIITLYKPEINISKRELVVFRAKCPTN